MFNQAKCFSCKLNNAFPFNFGGIIRPNFLCLSCILKKTQIKKAEDHQCDFCLDDSPTVDTFDVSYSSVCLKCLETLKQDCYCCGMPPKNDFYFDDSDGNIVCETCMVQGEQKNERDRSLKF